MKVARKKKKSRRREDLDGQVLFYTGEVKYDSVLKCATEQGWSLVGRKDPDKDRCNIYWVDICCVPDRLNKLKPWQCCNHFPGTSHIANKARMAKTLDKMARKFPKDYGFYPKTWVLPSEGEQFRAQFDDKGFSKQWYIVKPDGGCQGRGIFLTQNFQEALELSGTYVAQTYIRKPLLIDDFKFDLRLYILVASVRPLELYAFNDGLVRLCTEPYTKPTVDNSGDMCMHLTNYSLNKKSEGFQESDDADGCDEASKRSVIWLMHWLEQEYDEKKRDLVWSRMLSVCLKSMLAVLPTLQTEYDNNFGTKTSKEEWQLPSRCFEILGFDLMIDSWLKPWLVEVNHLPSFGTDSPFDLQLKGKMIAQAMNLINARSYDQTQYETEMQRRKDSTPDARRNRAVNEIKLLLERVAPSKLHRLEALLLSNHGEEERLLVSLQHKYADQLAEYARREAEAEIPKIQRAQTGITEPCPPKEQRPTSASSEGRRSRESCRSSLSEGAITLEDQESAAEDGEAAAAEAVDGDVLPSITRSPSLIRNPENCATLAPDFVRIWPLPANDEDSPMPSKTATYEKFEEFGVDFEARRLRRFVAPLLKYTNSEAENSKPARPPPIIQQPTNNTACFGRAPTTPVANLGPGYTPRADPKWKAPPRPSETQRAAADRLSRGRSSLPNCIQSNRTTPPANIPAQYQRHIQAAKHRAKYVLDKKAFIPIATKAFEKEEQAERLGLWQLPYNLRESSLRHDVRQESLPPPQRVTERAERPGYRPPVPPNCNPFNYEAGSFKGGYRPYTTEATNSHDAQGRRLSFVNFC